MSALPFVKSVFHPTDFSETSDHAFAHALAIALLREADLTILHAGRKFPADGDWRRFPAVRSTLERWGLLEPGTPRSAVFEELSVRVRKVNVKGQSPVHVMLEHLDEHETDLIVLATEAREGLPAWLRPSKAEQVARRSNTMTLFVPRGARTMVSLSDGSFCLRRILIPVARRPNARAPLTYAQRLSELLADEAPVQIVLLHVGPDERPPLQLDESPLWSYRREARLGDVVEQILEVAGQLEVDLIAMATDGRDGILGALGRGSHTERVVRGAPCPVLAVPQERGEA